MSACGLILGLAGLSCCCCFFFFQLYIIVYSSIIVYNTSNHKPIIFDVLSSRVTFGSLLTQFFLSKKPFDSRQLATLEI